MGLLVCVSVRRLLVTTKKDNDLKICRKNAVSRGFSAFLLDYLVENYIYIGERDFISKKIESKNMPVVVDGNEFRTLWFHV